MPVYSAREVAFAAAIQGAPTTETAPVYFLPHSGADFMRKVDWVQNEDAVGMRDKRLDQTAVRDYGSGPIGGFVDIQTMIWLMQNIFGNAGVSSVSGNVKTTSWDKPTASASRPYNTLYCKEPNVNEKFVGAVMDSLELNMAVESWMKYTAEFTSLKAEANTTALPAIPEPILFPPKNIGLYSANDVGGLSPGSEVEVKAVKLKIMNETEAYPKLNSLGFAAIPSKGLAVDLEITALFKDDTERNKWIANRFQALRILANAEKAAGTGSPSISQLQIDLNRVKYGEFKPSRGLGSLVEQVIPAMAYFDPTSGQGKTLSGQIKTHNS